MRRDDGSCPAEPGATAGWPHLTWQAIGPDAAALNGLVLALARFGVRTEPAEPGMTPSLITPVLCDGRSRAEMRSLLDQNPLRVAPLLVFGVNRADTRARLLLAGADDVVSSRIAPRELAARMIAAQRAREAAQGIIRLAGLSIDTGLRQVCWQHQHVPLMPREFDVLLVLARHAGLAVSRDTLLQTVWQTSFDPGTNSPEVHIFKLRRKLAVLGEAVRIETVKRQGYRLICDSGLQE